MDLGCPCDGLHFMHLSQDAATNLFTRLCHHEVCFPELLSRGLDVPSAHWAAVREAVDQTFDELRASYGKTITRGSLPSEFRCSGSAPSWWQKTVWPDEAYEQPAVKGKETKVERRDLSSRNRRTRKDKKRKRRRQRQTSSSSLGPSRGWRKKPRSPSSDARQAKRSRRPRRGDRSAGRGEGRCQSPQRFCPPSPSETSRSVGRPVRAKSPSQAGGSDRSVPAVRTVDDTGDGSPSACGRIQQARHRSHSQSGERHCRRIPQRGSSPTDRGSRGASVAEPDAEPDRSAKSGSDAAGDGSGPPPPSCEASSFVAEGVQATGAQGLVDESVFAACNAAEALLAVAEAAAPREFAGVNSPDGAALQMPKEYPGKDIDEEAALDDVNEDISMLQLQEELLKLLGPASGNTSDATTPVAAASVARRKPRRCASMAHNCCLGKGRDDVLLQVWGGDYRAVFCEACVAVFKITWKVEVIKLAEPCPDGSG